MVRLLTLTKLGTTDRNTEREKREQTAFRTQDRDMEFPEFEPACNFTSG